MSGDDHFVYLDNNEVGLLSCPFCGGKARRHNIEEREDVENAGASYIECSGCGACTQLHFDRKENLIDSWNRRDRDWRDECDLAEARLAIVKKQLNATRASIVRMTDILNEVAARDRQNFPPNGGAISVVAARGLREYDPTTQPYDEPFRHVERPGADGLPKWRAFYNVAYPKLWGIETSDPAAIEAGLEIVVAPCMPEHAAKDIAAAWNAKDAPAVADTRRTDVAESPPRDPFSEQAPS